MARKGRDETEIARRRKTCEVCGTVVGTGGGRGGRGNVKAEHFRREHPAYAFSLTSAGQAACSTCGKEAGSFGRLVKHYRRYHPSVLTKVVLPEPSVVPTKVAPLDLIDALVAQGRDPAVVLWDGLMTTLSELRSGNQALEDANQRLRAQIQSLTKEKESLEQELEADRRSRLSGLYDSAKGALAVHSED